MEIEFVVRETQNFASLQENRATDVSILSTSLCGDIYVVGREVCACDGVVVMGMGWANLLVRRKILRLYKADAIVML